MSNHRIVADLMKDGLPRTVLHIAEELGWTVDVAKSALAAAVSRGRLERIGKLAGGTRLEYRIVDIPNKPMRTLDFKPLVTQRCVRRPVFDAPGSITSHADGRLK